MEWTSAHDVAFCREIMLVKPFKANKGSPKRGLLWQSIADNLNQMEKPQFRVTKRAVSERYNLLVGKFQKKMKEEERASEISPEMSELDQLLEEIVAMETEGEITNDTTMDEMRKAQDMQKKAIEKLGDKIRRKENVDGQVTKRQNKKRRSSDNKTITYLRKKNESEKELTHETQEAFQRQQGEMMKTFQQMAQHQQQQNAALLSILEKFISKFAVTEQTVALIVSSLLTEDCASLE